MLVTNGGIMFNFEKQQQGMPAISETRQPVRVPRWDDRSDDKVDVATAVYSIYVAHQFRCWDACWENQAEIPANYSE